MHNVFSSVLYTGSFCFVFSCVVSLVCLFLLCFLLLLFSLKSHKEYRKRMTDIPVPAAMIAGSKKEDLSGFPKFKDWRKEGYVTPVRDQVRQQPMSVFLKPLLRQNT